MKDRPHGRLHVVGNVESTVVRSYDELAADLERATDIIVRQRRIIEALKLELERRGDSS